MPDIAVIIPAFNAERYIGEALSSVLAQTLLPAEIIVADDGSTDRTVDVAAAFEGVTVLRLPHRGVSAARNAAVAASSAAFLAFLDADDIWMPEKLAKQASVAAEQPEAGIVMARQMYRFEGPPPSWFRGPTDGGWEAGFMPSNWFMPRATWETVGPFHEGLTHSEDTDWLARASDLGVLVVTVPEILVVHRIHDRNASGMAVEVRSGIFSALRASVSRKREVPRDG
jgi:glycosyltransferase involved in cell wall biosynthesis